MRDEVTRRLPLDFRASNELSPAVLREEVERMLRHGNVRRAVLARGRAGAGTEVGEEAAYASISTFRALVRLAFPNVSYASRI